MYFGEKYQTPPLGDCVTEERRAILRRHLIFYLRVWDMSTDQLLGHIVDINTDGLMLISEKPIETGKAFDLEVRWQNQEGAPEMILFRAISRWSSNDVNRDFYDTGFQLINPSEAALNPILEVIREYGFSD